jgi:hypothetical protein
MGKKMKIALAVLYALQVAVIFRESVTRLARQDGEDPGGEKQKISETQLFSDTRALFQRAFQPLFRRHGMLAAAPAAAAAVLTEVKNGESHVHPPEHKKDLLISRSKIKRLNRYLIANLFPWIKKFRPPANAAETAFRPTVMDRATMFVGDC